MKQSNIKLRKIQLLLVCNMILFFLSGCGFQGKEEVYYPKPKLNQLASQSEELVTVVMRGDLTEEKTLTLFAKPLGESNLSFAVSGIKYDSFLVTVGDQVTKGQILARLDCKEYLEMKDAAKAELERVEATLAVQKPLFDQYAMSKADYDRKVADLLNEQLVLKQQIEELDLLLEERMIYADMDGVVKSITDIEPYDKSEEGKTMITLVSGEKVFSTTSADLAGLEVGKTYFMNTDDTSVEVVLDSAEEENGQYRLMFSLTGSSGDAADIERGKIKYTSYEMSNVLYVDQSAVSKVGDIYYVYYLQDGNRQVKEVKAGPIVNGCYVMEEGVAEGEELLCN